MFDWKTKELFQKLEELEQELGREPKGKDVERKCSETKGSTSKENTMPSRDTYVKRLTGTNEGWRVVMNKYTKWKETQNVAQEDMKDTSLSFAEKIRKSE